MEDQAPPVIKIKLELEPAEIDFICNRMTAGLMDFPTGQNVARMLVKIQTQSNDNTLQGRRVINLKDAVFTAQEAKK